MPSQQVSLKNQGNSDPIYIGLKNFAAAGVGLLVTITGSLTVNVQISGDQNVGPGKPPTNWNNHDSANNLTASYNANAAFPITAVRLNCSAYSSGSAVLNVIQAEF